MWLAGLVFGVGLTSLAKADPNIDETILQARALVSSVAAEYPGLAVTVTVDGKEVWAEGYGFADLESETPAIPDTRFNVYSVAKMLTGIGAARLAETGRLDLDASLVDIVDALPSHYAVVTPRHLIGHLSGVCSRKFQQSLACPLAYLWRALTWLWSAFSVCWNWMFSERFEVSLPSACLSETSRPWTSP